MSWGRLVRPGGNNPPRPLGGGSSGRAVRPMTGGVEAHITHRKYSTTGQQLWRADHGSAVRAIAVDSSGNIYTAGGLSSDAATYKLAKWTQYGSFVWGVLVDSDQGWDVDCDAAGNVWLAVGTALEKYSSAGALLATYNTISDPLYTAFNSSYVPDIKRVGVSPIGKVFFGTAGFTADYDQFNGGTHDLPWMSGNSMELDGTSQAVYYARQFAPVNTSTPGVVVTMYDSQYDFDSDGNLYLGEYFETNTAVTDPSFHICGNVIESTPSFTQHGLLHHTQIGVAQQQFISPVFPNYTGGGKIAVYRPDGSVLMGFGLLGAGEIKDLATLIPDPGLPYLQDQSAVVTEATAGANGVLHVNNNHRYVYGLNRSSGKSHRVRDYPSSLVWDADHGADVRDAIVQSDNTVLIAGDRVNAVW